MKDRFNLYRFASPATFYPLAGTVTPYFVAVSLVFGLAGLWLDRTCVANLPAAG